MSKKETIMKENLSNGFRKANIILFICAMATLVCYDIFGGLWLKGVTSSWFVVLGFVNLVYARKAGTDKMKPIFWLATGLVLGMLADVLLGISFLAGVVAFALGHLCYMIAYFTLEKPCRRDLICAIPTMVLTYIICFCTPYIRVEDPLMRKFLVVYSMILGCMLGKALSNYLARRSSFRLVLLLGSLLFWFSDLMLGVDMFGTPSRLTWILCSYVYWPAQNIIAHSLYHYATEKAQKD